jgi:ATP-dependent Clp protease protease subunit
MINKIKKQNNLAGLMIPIPVEVENLQLPDPQLLNYYKGLEERIIWIDQEITDDFILGLIKQIILWNKEDEGKAKEERKPIKVLIFSFGGDLYSTFALLDVIAASETPVHTYNMGVAMSAGLLLLLAGEKRYALKKSQVLIHSGSGGAGGTYEQVEAQTQAYKEMIGLMREYIIERTNIDTKLYKKYMSKEWYLYSDKQKELGIVDEIIISLHQI